MMNSAWWRDFQFEDGVVHVRKTGARVPVEPGVIAETLSWLAFYARIEVERLGVHRDGPRVWFAPDRPRPWYLIWPVAQLAGLRFADHPDQADLRFYFEDITASTAPQANGTPLINGQCLDTSKSCVAEIFKRVTGRTLAVNPAQWNGPMVVKSERNGAHDGRVLTGPQIAEPGIAYQRLIDNCAGDGYVEDLRCPTVGGQVEVVYLKRRPLDRRFANHNTEVRMLNPDEAFSPSERAIISDFCKMMKLDWGGLDVLRDRQTQDLWIVDANKTDMGPPIALPLADKLISTRKLARALRTLADTRL